MEWSNTNEMKTYEIMQVDGDGCQVVEPVRIEAESGDSAVKQLEQVAAETQNIKVCLDGDVMNEMEVAYWKKRVRGR